MTLQSNNNKHHSCESADTSLQDICHKQKAHLFMELGKNKDNYFQIPFYCSSIQHNWLVLNGKKNKHNFPKPHLQVYTAIQVSCYRYISWIDEIM